MLGGVAEREKREEEKLPLVIDVVFGEKERWLRWCGVGGVWGSTREREERGESV